MVGMLNAPDDGVDVPTSDPDIVREAIERFKDCAEWQGTSDERHRQDVKFAHGDARNAWQWPDKIYAQRTGAESELPALTINKTRVHNDLIINEISKNPFGIKIRPTGGKASARSAEVRMSLMRRIQNISKYEQHRRRCSEQCVDGGIGYIVIDTAYTSNRSRDQDIYLSCPRDPTAVYLDRWAEEPDGSDARFGFLFKKWARREFNRQYPGWAGKVGQMPLGADLVASWLTDVDITVAKYYRKIQRPDRYFWYRLDDGTEVEGLESELKDDTEGEDSKFAIFNALKDEVKDGIVDGGTRDVFDDEVKWYEIAGDTIMQRGDWAGKYIPICRCVGREIVVENELDRKGHTRALIDAQRMLNYGASCSVETVASQTRAQWLTPLRAIEGMQDRWKDANIKNYVVLPYNDVDDVAEGPLQAIAAPQRVDPAKPSAGWLQVSKDGERHMMMASGQYQSQLGQNDQGQTAISGKAIGQRQEQSDTATYHFVDHLRDMDTYIGVQLNDLIPKIYDTRRTLQVLDQKGELAWLMIDPDQDEAVREMEDLREQDEAVKLALNPAVGEYECVSDPGPSWATQREEAWEAISTILAQRPELTAVVGDLLFKVADFPHAEELQERMRKEIRATKPYLFDLSDPVVQQLQDQLTKALNANAELINQLADEKLKWRGRDEKRDIDAFKAETERFKAYVEAMAKLLLTPQQRAEMDHELNLAAHQHVFDVVQDTNKADLASEKSLNGAGS